MRFSKILTGKLTLAHGTNRHPHARGFVCGESKRDERKTAYTFGVWMLSETDFDNLIINLNNNKIMPKNADNMIMRLCAYYDECEARGVTPSARVLRVFDKYFDQQAN